MLILVDEFYLAALNTLDESFLDEHEDGQIEETETEEETESEQDQVESESGEIGEADSIDLEPEADPYKRLMNKLNYLLSTGTEDNLIYAFQLAQAAVNTGRFNYNSALADNISELYIRIRHTIINDPALRSLMNSSLTDREYSAEQRAENRAKFQSGRSFDETDPIPTSSKEPSDSLDKGPKFKTNDDPFAYKWPGAA